MRFWWVGLGVVIWCGAPSLGQAPPPLRTVVQTVFGVDGKPARGVTVTASFALGAELRLAHATADRSGRVTWEGLPREPVIVWGEGVPPVEIAAEDTAVTAPTPLRAPPWQWVDLEFGMAGASPGSDGSPPVEWFVDGQVPPQSVPAHTRFSVPRGAHLFAQGIRYGSPLALSTRCELYVPLRGASTRAPLRFELPWPRPSGVAVRGRLLNADGSPCAGVSRIAMVPLRLSGVRDDIVRRAALAAGGQPSPAGDVGPPCLARLRQTPGGFAADVAAPGAWRLIVDGWDVDTPAPPDFTIQVGAGGADVTVRLPPPLLHVPSGADVCWLSLRTPHAARQLAAAAVAPQMPVYLWPEDTAAVWYKPSPGQTHLWRNGPRPTVTELTEHCYQLWLSPKSEMGRLLPALPRAPASALPDLSLSTTPKYFDLPGTDHVAVGVPYGGCWSLVGLRPDSDSDAVVSLAYAVAAPVAPAARPAIKEYLVRFPSADCRGADEMILVRPDAGPAPSWRNGWAMRAPSPSQLEPMSSVLSVPAEATRATLVWRGVGQIRDLLLPPPQEGRDLRVIQLPPWQAEPSVQGRLVDEAGRPLADKKLLVLFPTPDDPELGVRGSCTWQPLTVRTADDGGFRVAGVEPGVLILLTTGVDGCSWPIQVPAGGLANRVLVRPRQPWLGCAPMRGGASYWWLPEGGAPERIHTFRGEPVPRVPPGVGGLCWSVQPSSGAAALVTSPDSRRLDAPGSLALSWPFDASLAWPRRVTLHGTGTRAGCDVTFEPRAWTPYPLLSLALMHIAAVPPGSWQLEVESRGRVLRRTVTITDRPVALRLKP